MTLSNYVKLQTGVPTRMHFTDHYKMDREIMDRDLGRPREITSHVMYVNELNGEPTSRTFSILSEKLWQHIRPSVESGTFRLYDFVITEMGSGFYKDWNVQLIKRPG